MKIKTKLVISFCIILFVPVLLTLCAGIAIKEIRVNSIEANYGIENAEDYIWGNQMQLLNRVTQPDLMYLKQVAEEESELFEDADFCQDMEQRLERKASSLVVVKGDQVLYQGKANVDVDRLPDGHVESRQGEICTIMDAEDDLLMKQVCFHFADGTEGSAYILTATADYLPEVKSLGLDVVLAMMFILFLTAVMLIIWIYQSLVTPIRKLQLAADNIKNGNLDFSIDVENTDEMGSLCQSFEEMRMRLKDNAAEKIEDEKESRALISNIAHDLKTPITAVKGYAEGILDGVANTPEKVEKYVRTIYNKANEMDTLINELTLYSKIDTNRIPYNFAKINVADYFDDCIEEIGLDLEAKQIGLAYFNYVDTQVEIIADPEQLRRVISNIVGNSVKYMNKTKSMINIRIKDVGDFIQVEIEDNGRGIAARDLPYIFDRFYRADASRNSATGGSGIGLSIVKKIIEDHGGKIWATSKEDTGTVMYFVIRKYQEMINDDDVVIDAE